MFAILLISIYLSCHKQKYRINKTMALCGADCEVAFQAQNNYLLDNTSYYSCDTVTAQLGFLLGFPLEIDPLEALNLGQAKFEFLVKILGFDCPLAIFKLLNPGGVSFRSDSSFAQQFAADGTFQRFRSGSFLHQLLLPLHLCHICGELEVNIQNVQA
jgi:hypothetical protein